VDETSETKFVNLTPHEIVIVGEDGKEKLVIPPSGKVARVEVRQEIVEEISGIPVVRTLPVWVHIPEPQEGVVYIVSSMVAQLLPYRGDVIAPDTSPSGVVRDEQGRIIGVKRFQRF
jgi:hypothetical protein